jgi:DNA-directed RNA polymerase subunit RPC12/RpoP
MNRKVIPSNFDWPLCPLPSGPNRSVDYICGNCRTVLLHAENSQMHDLLILCTECGAHNSTDAYRASVNGEGTNAAGVEAGPPGNRRECGA